MPHFRLEYSTNVDDELDHKLFFAKVHTLVSEFGSFQINSMKSRVTPCSKYFVADGGKERSFVHLEFSILPGRSADTKKKASALLLKTLKDHFPRTESNQICSFTVEIREMDGDSYSKLISGKE